MSNSIMCHRDVGARLTNINQETAIRKYMQPRPIPFVVSTQLVAAASCMLEARAVVNGSIS